MRPHLPVTLNNASDYRANGHYRTISDGLTDCRANALTDVGLGLG